MFATTWNQLIDGITRISEPVNLTIGFFDGVHLGHQKILRALSSKGSDEMVGESVNRRVVLTFRHHPRAVLTGTAPGMLTTLSQRVHQFSAMGVTDLVVIDFSKEFSLLSGEEFIVKLLEALVLRAMVVGTGFRCGRNRNTDAAALESLLLPAGVRLVTVDPVIIGSRPVSSTRIRDMVRQGDLVLAQAMMGMPYEVDLSCGFSSKDSISSTGTASIYRVGIAAESLEQMLPKPGVYVASFIMVDGEHLETVAEVTKQGVNCTLMAGELRMPLGLRFHRSFNVDGNKESQFAEALGPSIQEN